MLRNGHNQNPNPAKTANIKGSGQPAWSKADLRLFLVYTNNRFSHDVAHMLHTV